MFIKNKALVLKNQASEGKKTYIVAYAAGIGKITYLVKGIDRNEAKLKSALLPFSYSEIIAIVSQGKLVITRATLIKNLYPQKSFEAQTIAFYVTDLADKLIEEGIWDEQISSLLLTMLNLLKGSSNKRLMLLVLSYFPLKLIKYLGYFPELSSCVNCAQKLSPQHNFLSYKKGGLLCPKCKRVDQQSLMINQQELNFIKQIAQHNFNFVRKTTLNDKRLKELANFANLYASYITGDIPKSYFFYKNSFSLSLS